LDEAGRRHLLYFIIDDIINKLITLAMFSDSCDIRICEHRTTRFSEA